MKIKDESKRAETREKEYQRDIAYQKKNVGRRLPPEPVRDDRGEQKAWRPGDRA